MASGRLPAPTVRSAATPAPLRRVSVVRLYVRCLGASIRAQMAYRTSFVLQSVGQLLSTGSEFVGLWMLFGRAPSLAGWSLPQVAVFYGVIHVAFALAEAGARGFDVFPMLVRSGEFDRMLLRPRGTAVQVAAHELQLMRVGRLLQGLAALAWGMGATRAVGPSAWLLLGWAAIGGACIFAGLFILQATVSFWTVESLEIANTVTYGGVQTAQYPLGVYRPWLRRFFTFVVPLACANYLPLSGLVGDRGRHAVPLAVAWASPAAGLVFLLAALAAWHMGVRHYRSTGS